MPFVENLGVFAIRSLDNDQLYNLRAAGFIVIMLAGAIGFSLFWYDDEPEEDEDAAYSLWEEEEQRQEFFDNLCPDYEEGDERSSISFDSDIYDYGSLSESFESYSSADDSATVAASSEHTAATRPLLHNFSDPLKIKTPISHSGEPNDSDKYLRSG